MKKIVSIIFLLCLSGYIAHAQISGPRLMKNAAGTTVISTGDTITSTETLYLYSETMTGGSKVTIQLNGIKSTGTVSFTATLEYSADGEALGSHKWYPVDTTDAPVYTGTDGANVVIWPYMDKAAKHYRVKIVNASGTSMLKAWSSYW